MVGCHKNAIEGTFLDYSFTFFHGQRKDEQNIHSRVLVQVIRVQNRQHRQSANSQTSMLNSSKYKLRWVLTPESVQHQDELPSLPSLPFLAKRIFLLLLWEPCLENCANCIQRRSPDFSCQTTINLPIPDKKRNVPLKRM